MDRGLRGASQVDGVSAPRDRPRARDGAARRAERVSSMAIDLFLEVGRGNCARGGYQAAVADLPRDARAMAALQRQDFAALGLQALIDESIGSLQSHREQAQLALVFRDGAFSVHGGDAARVLEWAIAHRQRRDVVAACLTRIDALTCESAMLQTNKALGNAIAALRTRDENRLPAAEAAAHEVLAWASSGYSDLDMSVPWCDVAAASAVHALARLARGKPVDLDEFAADLAAVVEINDARRLARRRLDGRELARTLWP